jgi:hypothetical protein
MSPGSLEKYTEPKYSSYKSVNEKRTVDEKLFFLLTQDDVDRVPAVDGKALKCKIKTTDAFRLQSRSLELHSSRRPCGCDSCRANEAEGRFDLQGCSNAEYMRAWQAELMEAKDARSEYHTRSSKQQMLEAMAQQVVLGQVVAVEHSDRDLAEEYDYFLLEATTTGYVVTETMKDDFGADFVPGDIVVEVSSLCFVL